MSPPDAAAASASAASFALWISAPSSRSCTVIVWPACSGMRDPPTSRRLRGTVTIVVRLQVLQRDDHGHQLRDARDREPLVRVVRREHLAVRRVDDVERARVAVRRRGRARRAGERAERDHGGDSEDRRRIAAEGYWTRIFWPTWSAFELTPGLSRSSSATVVPVARRDRRRRCRPAARRRTSRRTVVVVRVLVAVVGVCPVVTGAVTGVDTVGGVGRARRRARSGSAARRP